MSLLTALPFLHAQSQHLDVLADRNKLHAEELFLEEKQFQEDMSLSTILHRRTAELARELHYSQMAHDIEFARREAIRDVWVQRGRREDTLMVINILMFNMTFSILVEGTWSYNPDVPDVTCWIYAVFTAASLATLSLSMALVISLHFRLNQFDMHKPYLMYKCGRTHCSFHDYYSCHCRTLSRTILQLFYAGSALNLLSACLHGYIKFAYDYFNVTAAICFLVFLCPSLLLLMFGERLWPSTTCYRPPNSDDDEGYRAAQQPTVQRVHPSFASVAMSPSMESNRSVSEDLNWE